MTFYKLNLPNPSETLCNLTRRIALSIPLNQDNKRWLDEFYNNSINATLHLFGHFDKDVNQQILAEYQNFFPKHTVNTVISIMKNNTNNAACLPPHSDRGRKLAINCYIDLGGDQVETVFYKTRVSTKETTSTNILYNDTGGIDHTAIFSTGWYAYNVDQIHSVENLESTRIFFSIIFDGAETTYGIEQLLEDYPELVKSKIQD